MLTLFYDAVGEPAFHNRYSYVNSNPVNLRDPLGLFACSNESLPLIQLACGEVNSAMERAGQENLPISIPANTVEAGVVSFENLKDFVQSTFGFRVAGFSGESNTPITECTSISELLGSTSIPSKLTLLRTTAALIHIASKFKQAGIGNGLSPVNTQLGNGTTIQMVADRLLVQNQPLGALKGFVDLSLSTAMNVFLGSEIETSAIVHELGHLFDKKFGLRPSTPLEGLYLLRDTGKPTYNSQAQGSPNPVDTQFAFQGGLQGRANESRDQEEVWADMFMTWVLFGQGMRVNGNLVGWNVSQERDWRFKRLYTIEVVTGLLSDRSNLPQVGASEAEMLQFIRPIATVANLLHNSGGNSY